MKGNRKGGRQDTGGRGQRGGRRGGDETPKSGGRGYGFNRENKSKGKTMKGPQPGKDEILE